MEIEEIRKKRFQFLKRVYELTNGHKFGRVNMFDIGNELGFDNQLTENISFYLNDEGLIKFIAFGGLISITHLGVREIEDALSNPDSPTTHFPPINIISINKMISSQIQQSIHSGSQLFKVNDMNLDKLYHFIKELKKSIDKIGANEEQKQDIIVDLETIEKQL
jgi:hypothetical protein